MRHLRNLIAFAFGFALAVVIIPAFAADEYPATKRYTFNGATQLSWSDLNSACSGSLSSYTGIYGPLTQTSCTEQSTGQGWSVGFRQSNNSTGSYSGTITYSCPHGGTVNNVSGVRICINAPDCQSGYTRDALTGECKKDTPPPPDQCTLGFKYGDESTVVTDTCINGCGYVGGAKVCASGSCDYYGPFTGTGRTCGDEEPEPDECPPGDYSDACMNPPDPDDGGGDNGGDTGGEGGDTGGEGGDTGGDGGTGGEGGDTGGGSSGGGSGGAGTGGDGDGEGDGDGDGTGGDSGGGGSPGDGEGEGECEGEDCEQGGQPAEIGDLYDKKEKTLGSVLEQFRTRIGAAPVVQDVSAFFQVSAVGACPTWSATIPIVGTITINHFCSSTALHWLSVAGYAVMALAAFTAFRWALL